MFEGLISVIRALATSLALCVCVRTTVDNPMHVVQVCEALQHRVCDFTDHLNVDRPDFLVNAIQGALVHELHAYADVGVRDKRAVEGDNVLRVTVVHDLQFAKDLLPYRWLRVDEDDLETPSR